MKRITPILKVIMILATIGSAVASPQKAEKALGQDLRIEKTDNQDEAKPGQSLRYKITCKNLGTTEAQNVSITDFIPKYTTYVSASPLPDTVGKTSDGRTYIKWKIAFIDSNTVKRDAITLTVRVVDQAQLPSGTTTLLDVIWIDNPLEHDEASDETNVTALPDLIVLKTDDLDVAEPGQRLTYTTTYRNDGNKDAHNVVVTDTLPPHTSYDSSSSGGTYDSKTHTATWNLDTIPPGGGTTLSMSVVIDSVMPLGLTTLINKVVISTPDDEFSKENNEDTDTTKVIATRDLKVRKDDGREYAAPGDILTYEIRYQNTGNMAARNVALTDSIPAHTSFISVSSSGDTLPGGRVVKWELGTIPKNSDEQVELKVRIDGAKDFPLGVTELINKASISTPDPEDTIINNEATDITKIKALPDLIVLKTDGLDAAEPGQRLTYTITYRNDGNKNAYNVRLTDTLPSHTSYESSSSGGTYDSKTHTVTWDLDTISPGAGTTLSASVVIDSIMPLGSTTLVNKVVISTPDDEFSKENNRDTDTTKVVAIRDLEVRKDDGCEYAAPGDTLTYEIRYQNTGNMTARNVTLTDTIPTHTSFVWASPGDSLLFDDKIVKWKLGTIPKNSGGRVKLLKVRIGEAEDFPLCVADLINKASISTPDPEDTIINNEATDATKVKVPLELSRNRFNPDNGQAVEIKYCISEPGDLEIRVYNLTGELIKDVFIGHAEAGPDNKSWDGTNDDGTIVASGVYIITLQSHKYKHWKKVIVLR